MVDITIKVLAPAVTTDLITLAELKTSLGLGAGPAFNDPQLEQAIFFNSYSLAVRCNRVFASERVEETWHWDGCDCLQNPRIFLTHFPVLATDIESVTTGGTLVDPTTYELDEGIGKLRYLLGGWIDPTVITYTGGYVLPDDAPPALKQAATILTRGAYYSSLTSSAVAGGMRAISHKHARVTFFDPFQQAQMAMGGPGVQQAVESLISHYTRYSI